MYAPHARMTSTAFLEAYRRCMSDVTAADNQEVMFIPALVCAAFSAEVGLKALLLQAGQRGRGHDLVELFQALPEELRLEIVRFVGKTPEDFVKNLTDAKNAFLEWRYIYESADARSISLEFVARFATAIARANPLNKLAAVAGTSPPAPATHAPP